MTDATPDLTELIPTVRDGTPDGNELDQLAAAVSHAATVGHRTDELLGHFMTAADHAGFSHRQIRDQFAMTPKFMQTRFLNQADFAKPWEGFVHPDVRPMLEDLVAETQENMPAGTTALDAVGVAARRGREIRALTDELVGYFIDRARTAGASWAQILQATNLADTRGQAPFRKTSQFIHAVTAAHSEGIRLNHTHADTADLLWGALSDDRAVSARLLESAEPIRTQLASRPTAAEPSNGAIPFVGIAGSLITRRAPAEARKLDHEYISTGHLLLALAAEPESYARAILDQHQVEYDQLRQALIDLGEPCNQHEEY